MGWWVDEEHLHPQWSDSNSRNRQFKQEREKEREREKPCFSGQSPPLRRAKRNLFLPPLSLALRLSPAPLPLKCIPASVPGSTISLPCSVSWPFLPDFLECQHFNWPVVSSLLYFIFVCVSCRSRELGDLVTTFIHIMTANWSPEPWKSGTWVTLLYIVYVKITCNKNIHQNIIIIMCPP